MTFQNFPLFQIYNKKKMVHESILDIDSHRTGDIYAQMLDLCNQHLRFNSLINYISEVKSEPLDDNTKDFYHPNQLSINCLLYTSPSPRDRG